MTGFRLRLRGFTLIELIVAMFVAAVMFAIGYGAIRQALASRERVAASQARLVAVQTAMRVMTQDFSQLEPRPVRNSLGSGLDAAVSADPRTTTLATFTRAGWANPSGLPRSTLQRVAYSFDQNKLVRLHWPVLDATQGTVPLRRELLDKLTSVKLRWMDVGAVWRDEWPPVGAQNPPNAAPSQLLRMRPLAVEITLQTEDFGTLTRLVEVH